MPSRVLKNADIEPYRPIDRQLADDPAAAQQALERAMNEAYAEGMQRADTEIRNAVEAERKKVRENFAASLEEIHALRARIYREIQDEVVKLAIAIAERIVRCRIEDKDPVALRVAQEVLSAIGSSSKVKIRLNQDDHSFVQEAIEGMDSSASVELLIDPDVEPGGVLVEYDDEGIDARLQTALAAITATITEESRGQ